MKILILDQDQSYAKGIALAINRRGRRIVYLSNPRDAIAELYKYPKDLVLLGLGFKTINDLSLVKTIRALSPGSRIIAWSANSEGGSVEIREEGKVNIILEKPFSITNLEKAIIKTFNH